MVSRGPGTWGKPSHGRVDQCAPCNVDLPTVGHSNLVEINGDSFFGKVGRRNIDKVAASGFGVGFFWVVMQEEISNMRQSRSGQETIISGIDGY